MFLTFVTQMVAFRLGTEALAKLGNSSPPHVHVMGHPGHVQEQDRIASTSGRTNGSEDETAVRADSLEKGSLADEDEEAFLDASEKNPVVAQVRKESQPLPSEFNEEEKAETAVLFSVRGEQIMGVATLEFGVCLHSVIIGLTLAVTEDSGFDVLFIVIIFHQVRSPT